MAAGIGSRFGGLKQIVPVGPGGEIIVDYSIFDAIRAGFGHIVFVIRREIERDFRERIESRWANRIAISYVYQELTDVPGGFSVPAGRTKPWGTGHAVYACRNAVKQPFGLINADDFYGRSSFQLLAERLRTLDTAKPHFCLVAFTLRNTLSRHGSVSRGVCEVAPGGQLAHIAERTKIEADGDAARCLVNGESVRLTGDEAVSMNFWGFTPVVFRYLEQEFRRFMEKYGADPSREFQLPAVVDIAIRDPQGRVDVLRSADRWLGVTYPDDRDAVAGGIRRLIESGAYPAVLSDS